jgi:hypothetical protein
VNRLTKFVVAVLLTAPFFSTAAERPEQRKGRELADNILHRRPAESTVSQGTLRLRRPDGKRASIPVEVRVALEEEQWTTSYRAKFPDGRSETLTVVTRPEGAPEYILHRTTPQGQVAEIRPQRPDELSTAFAGTDFWLIDLGMAFLHWPEQRLKGQEKRRTRSCYVLESIHPEPTPGTDRRVVTWVDEETLGIVRAEAYDSRNRLLKEFSPGKFARVGNRYELKDMEIINTQTDSRTTLQFEVEDPKKLGVTYLPGVE